jgi:membrane protease YdiL (CAAX protease family)
MGSSGSAAASNARGHRPDGRQAPAQHRITRGVAVAIPVVVPVGMRVLFPMLARRLGARRGYLTGFALYWAGCYLVPLALLGPRRVRALLGPPEGPLPRPRGLAAAALLVPPLGAAGAELLPGLPDADWTVAATTGALAVVNATGEELLWRGLFVATFPEDPVRGWLWPAIGFTAWHLAPTSVRPSRHGKAFLAGSALIGAGFGWVAWRTRSLRWTLLAHLATETSGRPTAHFWLGRESTSS